jgi:hypothetical protein
VKNRFQNLPFKCNLQRYSAVVPPQLRSRMKGILCGEDLSVLIAGAAVIELDVGLCTS